MSLRFPCASLIMFRVSWGAEPVELHLATGLRVSPGALIGVAQKITHMTRQIRLRFPDAPKCSSKPSRCFPWRMRSRARMGAAPGTPYVGQRVIREGCDAVGNSCRSTL